MRESEALWKKEHREEHLASMRSWHQRNGRTPEAIAAQKKRSKEFYERRKNDPEFKKRRTENSVAYQRTPKGKRRKIHWSLLGNHGMTIEEYDEKMILQNGRCAICNRPVNEKKSLAVDHDHETEENRGLLCEACNRGLGMLQDSPEILRAALAYLALWGKT